MAGLIVKLDGIAALREGRSAVTPEPVSAAVLAELAGADGVAIHLRENRRHIQDRDLRLLRRIIQTELHLYMPPSSEMVGIALDARPDTVVLTPETGDDTTGESTIDLVLHRKEFSETVATLQNNSIRVTLRLKPDPEQIKLAHQINANQVELDAAALCNATSVIAKEQAFAELVNTVKLAKKFRLGVNVGNRICDKTIKTFKGLDEVDMFCIGHSIIAKAVLVGMERAVRDMLKVIHRL